MRKSPRILYASIATLAALSLGSPTLTAQTVDNFTAGNPANTPATPADNSAAEGGPLSIVEEEGNSFLRLTSGENGQNNSYTYNLAEEGAFNVISATFDFRILPGTAGLADGMGFILLPTSTFGPEGPGATPLPEKPDLAGAFGLGIDVYPNINNISTHWDGFQQTEMNPSPNVDFRSNGVFNRVQIDLVRVGNATNATVTLTPDSLGAVPGAPYKIMEVVMPNMLPYENRVELIGRTGGENMTIDVDNLRVESSSPFLGIPDAPAESIGHLYQDFDSAGTTGYRVVQVSNTTPTAFQPGPVIKAAEAPAEGTSGSDGAFLRIANDAVNSQNNRIVFNRAGDSGASTVTEVFEMDVRFNSGDQAADGLGLLFLPITNAADVTSTGLDVAEEPNVPGALGVGFDVYPNGGPDVAPGISLHYNGTKLTDISIAGVDLSEFNRVQVVREPVAGGLNVSVIATTNVNGTPGAPVTLVDDFFIAGARNYENRVQLTGRTGGLNADHDVDNIRSFQVAAAPTANTRTDFSPALQSPWKAYAYGANQGAMVRSDLAVNGDFLRLVNDAQNSQANAIAFDKQLDGSIAGATSIKAEFAFRMASADGNPADGLAFMLIPTVASDLTPGYGNTGPGAAGTGGFVAEEPNLPGVFGIGLDLYDGGREFNEISVHWNGLTVTSRELLDDALLNLDSNQFHKLSLELKPSGADTLVSLTLVPNTYGSPFPPISVFDNVLVEGMSFYDYRVEFAARTGGANMNVDLDDILVQTVPEPTSMALLAIGGVAMGCFRRPRRRSA